ncbi:endonuclease/exonuclease/phosphatase family protein [Cryptosporidium muris RN66]|uniref:phosphoinositide 5-phosphatase n=1 Tax=Cryptosporidium muris (strain RN66) TaxID=441375 RepID=B6AE82_CRYMR|nr:endonuclease/exonuclease/phosphatase family protein [Cryptosporidium muris RN66]EEA06523.1 endonuclease/exonuclease/phosphatase family protein [Cryptosporidium muris RN66]|eukprot:XP_002140872.1 endonuclease/exonuclease/phosphatase family protein [Cryptosporidium muris RN66]
MQTGEEWKCCHNGSISTSFYYKVHTFTGAIEISLVLKDNKTKADHLNQDVRYPRLVIIRPSNIFTCENITSITLDHLIHNQFKDSDDLCNDQLRKFCENCIFEIKNEEDMPLLMNLRKLYGPPEFLDADTVIGNSNIHIVENDESGYPIINWEGSNANIVRTNLKHSTDNFPNIGDIPKEDILRDEVMDISTYSVAIVQALSIVGILTVLDEPFLLLITECQPSCIIYQNESYKCINKVTKSLAVPLISQMNTKLCDKMKFDDIGKIHLNTTDPNLNINTLNNSDFKYNKLESSPIQSQDSKPVLLGTQSFTLDSNEWVQRVSQTLQKMSPRRSKKEALTSLWSPLGETGAQWLSNSFSNVSSGIFDSVATAFISKDSVLNNGISGNSTTNQINKNPNDSEDSPMESATDRSEPASIEDILSERQSCIERLVNGVTRLLSSGGFYFSFDMDLTRSLQQKFQDKWIDKVERVDLNPDKANNKDFYNLIYNNASNANILSGDSRFIWNKNISIPLLHANIDPRWVTPLVQGYFGNQAVILSSTGPGLVRTGSDILNWKCNTDNWGEYNLFNKKSNSDIEGVATPEFTRLSNYTYNSSSTPKVTTQSKKKLESSKFEEFRYSKLDREYLKNHYIYCNQCHKDYLDGLTRFDLVIMSRRSWEKGGTRFNARGVDDNGNVANFVETELQICINTSDEWTSFLQIRGSVPVFWEQSGVASANLISVDDNLSNLAFYKHQKQLCDHYGQILYVNLLGSAIHEKALTEALIAQIDTYNKNLDSYISQLTYDESTRTGFTCICGKQAMDIEDKEKLASKLEYNIKKDNKKDNQDTFSKVYDDNNLHMNIVYDIREMYSCHCFCTCFALPILYSSYDYHQKVKNLGFEDALQEYISILAQEYSNNIGYFHGCFKTRINNLQFPDSNLEDTDGEQNIYTNEPMVDPVILNLQQGVIRTNCLDCLDRTNAVQWYIAWTWLVDWLLNLANCDSYNSSRDSFQDNLSSIYTKRGKLNKTSQSDYHNLQYTDVNIKDDNSDMYKSTDIFDNQRCSNTSSQVHEPLIEGQISYSGWVSSNNNNFFHLKQNPQINQCSDMDLSFEIRNRYKKLGLKHLKNLNSSMTSNCQFMSPLSLCNPIIPSRLSHLNKTNNQTTSNLLPYRRFSSNTSGNLKNYEKSLHITDDDEQSSYNISEQNKHTYNILSLKRCLNNGMAIVTLKDAFSYLWAENGDAISEIYAGAGSVFSGVIKNRKVSLSTNFDHALKSLRRLYHNTFEDSSRQQYIDCLLSKHPASPYVNQRYRTNFCSANCKISKIPCEQSKFPKLTVWVGTWNLAGQQLQEPLDKLINSDFPKNTSIACFCLQEMVELNSVRIMFSQGDKNREATWEYCALNSLGSQEYVKVQSVSLVGLFCIVFVRRSLLNFISSVNIASLKLGLMGNVGNKGAVCIRMNIKGYGNIAFANVHLSSGEQNKEDRTFQLRNIMNSPIFINNDFGTFEDQFKQFTGSCLSDHDVVIMAGDFNFRIQLSRSQVMKLIQENNLQQLASYDEFIIEQANRIGSATSFSEGELVFYPTYKFVRGEDSYDSTRTPAWCDRVLFYTKYNKNIVRLYKQDELLVSLDEQQIDPKVRHIQEDPSIMSPKPKIQVIKYSSNSRYYGSDHKPVVAILSIQFE